MPHTWSSHVYERFANLIKAEPNHSDNIVLVSVIAHNCALRWTYLLGRL
jgi:hypothetical protein